MTTVSPMRTPQLSAVLYTITTMHVSSLSTMPKVLENRVREMLHHYFYMMTPVYVSLLAVETGEKVVVSFLTK